MKNKAKRIAVLRDLEFIEEQIRKKEKELSQLHQRRLKLKKEILE